MFKQAVEKIASGLPAFFLLVIVGCAARQSQPSATFQIKRVEPPNEFLVTGENQAREALSDFDELTTRYTLQEGEEVYIISGRIAGYDKDRIRIMVNEVMAQITLSGDPCQDDTTAFSSQDAQKDAAQDIQRFVTQNVYRRRITNINGKISVEECGEAHTAIPFPGLVNPDAAAAQVTGETLTVTVPKQIGRKFEYKTIPVEWKP
jgi:HSP20 family molecular chaperone IbpA